jgi:hypothetical protein
MNSRSQGQPKETHCCICGTTLDPDKPLTEERPIENLSSTADWFYCLDCWFTMKSIGQRTAAPKRLAKVLERVLLA